MNGCNFGVVWGYGDYYGKFFGLYMVDDVDGLLFYWVNKGIVMCVVMDVIDVWFFDM